MKTPCCKILISDWYDFTLKPKLQHFKKDKFKLIYWVNVHKFTPWLIRDNETVFTQRNGIYNMA